MSTGNTLNVRASKMPYGLSFSFYRVAFFGTVSLNCTPVHHGFGQ